MYLLVVTGYSKALNRIKLLTQDDMETIRHQRLQTNLRALSEAPPLHELFVFSDITTVRRNIIGAPRAALHTALNNPHFYMQCQCCVLREQTQLMGTLPDLSVVYKLHLECGRMINLFDWLQARIRTERWPKSKSIRRYRHASRALCQSFSFWVTLKCPSARPIMPHASPGRCNSIGGFLSLLFINCSRGTE
ncbi:origin of replication complex subunit 3-like [Drosophila miranda]|uniref:origin of replication complex subunit 3-like n=1 Tax=Drosophila miranda TaxID=7229 RepID=UPI00143F0818|nr:origin of replication complex subunit 3-like [Drosophila miranda]